MFVLGLEEYALLGGILGGNLVGHQLQKNTKDDPVQKLAVNRFFFFFNYTYGLYGLWYIFTKMTQVIWIWLL